MEYRCSMIGDRERVRFVLEKAGERQLVVVGLNPSVANEEEPDPTVRIIMGIAEREGFDGFCILNLYPQRATDPKNLHKELDCDLHSENLRQIFKATEKIKNPTVLLAYGSNIDKVKYLRQCARDIIHTLEPLSPSWKCIRLTKAGHPRHPLYTSYCGLQVFDVEDYLTNAIAD